MPFYEVLTAVQKDDRVYRHAPRVPCEACGGTGQVRRGVRTPTASGPRCEVCRGERYVIPVKGKHDVVELTKEEAEPMIAVRAVRPTNARKERFVNGEKLVLPKREAAHA